jgi:hypothetical protein
LPQVRRPHCGADIREVKCSFEKQTASGDLFVIKGEVANFGKKPSGGIGLRVNHFTIAWVKARERRPGSGVVTKFPQFGQMFAENYAFS